jgi:hypothetical protein
MVIAGYIGSGMERIVSLLCTPEEIFIGLEGKEVDMLAATCISGGNRIWEGGGGGGGCGVSCHFISAE